MTYAIYVKSSPKSEYWMLIGFADSKKEAEPIALKRVKNMGKSAKWNTKRFKTMANAPERLKSLRG